MGCTPKPNTDESGLCLSQQCLQGSSRGRAVGTRQRRKLLQVEAAVPAMRCKHTRPVDDMLVDMIHDHYMVNEC